MNEILEYEVEAGDFEQAGWISDDIREKLRELGIDAEIIRRVAIALYQGEINMIIHANGGLVSVEITDDCIIMTLTDKGPGIEDIDEAMKEGFSTADENLKSRGYGEGMGFTNMKKYTDEMTVDSKLGEGTRLVMKVYID